MAIKSLFEFPMDRGNFRGTRIDPRYDVIKKVLEAGVITKFTDIFDFIPHSVVAKDFRTSNKRMKKMTQDPGCWEIGELYKLADLIGWDKKKLVLMAMDEGKKNPGA